MTWWHYTLETALLKIMADGRIRRGGAQIVKGERPAVWFSCRAVWEPTASRGFGDRRTGVRRDAKVKTMVRTGGALVRIEVSDDVARYTWREHRKLGGVDPRVADAIEATAREAGADPSEWRASYDDVPIDRILRIEVSRDGTFWWPSGRILEERKARAK